MGSTGGCAGYNGAVIMERTMRHIPNTDRINLRWRNGMWYARKQHNGKRIERCLGTADRDVAMERAKHVVSGFCQVAFSETWAEVVKDGLVPNRGWLWKIWQGGIRRKPESTITLEDLERVALRSGGRCEVSGIPFDHVRGVMPYQASIDRIDGARPYTADNVRMVCLIVNYCMGKWGQQAFEHLAISMAARYLERLERIKFSGEFAGQPFSTKNAPS